MIFVIDGNFGKMVFIVDMYGCIVFYGLWDIVDINVVIKNSRCVYVCFFYGGFGKVKIVCIG